MKSGLTELVFILDRSGSMGGLERDTVRGFNSMLDKQRKEKGETRITTILFDDEYEKLHDRSRIKQVRELTQEDYYVRGCTALLDAMGQSIQQMIQIQKNLPKTERAEKIIFAIITDGLENASREYSRDRVRFMIESQKEKYGWEFLFLGANMDAVAEASTFGISADRSVTFQNDSQGIEKNYRAVSEAICSMRCASSEAPVGAGWKKEIEADYRSRGRKFFNKKQEREGR